MHASIHITDHAEARVPATILGHNIETALTTVNGLLSDRLRNPKFTGPPHRMNGVAPEWQGASCGRAAYELTPGAGLEGSEAQLIRANEPNVSPSLHQHSIAIREDEDLELEIWARAWHRPVTLTVDLRPLPNRLEPYATARVTVDTSYYSRYAVTLHAPRTDEEARLSISVEETGELWIDQIHLRPVDEPLLCEGVIDQMGEMRIPALRFPGGIVANAYNWKHGIGPAHLRPAMLEAAFHQDWYLNYDFGVDEMLSVCHEQDATPTLTVNVATGTPEEAGELAAYCASWYTSKGVDPPLVYWHIGNHPYHYTTAHMTPGMYVDVLRRFVPAVTQHYPNCRIVAVMSRAQLDAPKEEAAWREAIFKEAAGLVDVVEVQTYGGIGATPQDPGSYTGGVANAREQVHRISTVVADVEHAFTACSEDLASRSLEIKLGIAEWNWWMQASHWDGRDFAEPPVALHGLFTARMIHAFSRLAPTFEVAHFYNLVNCMGILNHRGAEVEVTGSVELFKLYRPALPGDRIALSVVGPGGEESPSNASGVQSGASADEEGPLDALCLRNEAGTWLFVINSDPEQPAEFTVDGRAPDAQSAVCLAGATTVSPLEGGIVQSGTGSKEANGRTLIVPPLSITRCLLGE